MNIDYGQMKSQTMGVLTNPTIISYSLIFCSTLILGYYTLHDSQAFKPSEESGEKPEIAEENKSSFGFPSFGNANAEKTEEKTEEKIEEKTEENKSFFGNTNAVKTEEKPAEKPAENKSFFGNTNAEKPEESKLSFDGPAQEPKPEKEPPKEEAKPEIGGTKKSRKRNKKIAKKDNKSKKNHKL